MAISLFGQIRIMFLCINIKNLHTDTLWKVWWKLIIGFSRSWICKKLLNNRQTQHTQKNSLESSTQSELMKWIVPKSCTYRSNRSGDHHVCYIFDKLLGVRRQWSLNSKLVFLWRDRNHRVCQLPTERAPVFPFIDSQVPSHFLSL